MAALKEIAGDQKKTRDQLKLRCYVLIREIERKRERFLAEAEKTTAQEQQEEGAA